MERGGPVVGYEPTSGLWGAEGGVKLYANRGPVEHQASLTSEMTVTLDLNFQSGIGRSVEFIFGSAWAACNCAPCISTEKGKLP